MSFVTQTARKSSRIFAVGLFIALISTIVTASGWDDVPGFARQGLFAGFLNNQTESDTLQKDVAALMPKTVNNEAFAPLVGTYNIPGDYTDLAAAINDLNNQGVGGAVTLNLVAGNPQTAPAGGYVIGGTGSLVLTTTSASNTVTIQGNSNTITASNALTAGALNDGIFKIIGADFVTIDSFTMLENPANTTTAAGTNNMTEWGVALLYVTTTDGAQNDSITNCTIDLDRTYQNTFGIYANATHSATTVTTSATATGAAGGNTGLKIQSSVIADVNNGIVIVGPTAAADQQDNITVGGASAAFGNTLSNIGTTGTFSGYANVSGTVNGILLRNTKNYTIGFNNVQMSNGGVTVTGTINGIQIPASSNAPTGTLTQNINNNTISVRGGNVANVLNGINMPSTSVNATTTVNINNNDFNTFGHTVAGGTGAITFITQGGNPLTQNMNGNTFSNISVNTTGTITFFSFAPSLIATGAFSLNNNSIATGFTRTGAGTTTIWSSNASSVAGSTQTINNNNFSNITLTGASTFTGISNTDGPTTGGPTKTITGNTFNNISGTTNTITPLVVGFSTAATVSGNTISNISGGSTITGLTLTSVNQNAFSNTINSLSSTGAAAVTGIAVTAGTTNSVSRNKIYDLSGNNAGTTVNGILVSAGTTVNIFNNLVGDLRATAATSTTDVIRGISSTSAATANINVSFNTVYLNATSSGANFGSSALFHTTSATATTADLTAKDNIFVNTSTAAGTGITAAYRRSSTTLTNYDAASNNNLFYAGAPSATNLIFYDGTNSDQTLATYKARVATRDSASITENPPFLSTTGSNANFLHINTAIATQIESGGIPVAGITNDFDNDMRNATTPDIGADEFTGTLLDLIGPTITYTPFTNTTSTANRNLTVTITDASGIAGGAFAPRIYFRKNGGSYFSTQCTGSSPTYTCTVDYSLVGGVAAADIIDYFVIAQDTAGNVSINPSAGASATNVNSVTTPPTAPSTYTIAVAFPSTVNVPGDYPSLTNAGGLFEAMNGAVFTGNTVVNITADLTAETGLNALNKLAEEGGGAGTYTVLMRPTGAARTISGSIASNALIRLNGANRVTIDGSTSGGTDRSLTITNTSTTTPQVIRFGSIGTTPIVNDTLKNCIIINGVNTSSAVTITDTAGTAGYFNNLTIQNNDIQKAFVGVFANAVVLAGNGSGLTYTQNKLDTSGTNAIRIAGLYMQGVDGGIISNNTVGNFNATNDENDTGIWLATGTVNTTVSDNTISGIGYTGTGAFATWGIRDSAGATASGNNITQNNVSNITSNGSTTGSPTVFGIDTSSGGTTIQRNNVQGINATNTGTFGATGINITGGNNAVVKNNFVSNVTGDMTGGAAFSTTFGVFGIRIAAGTGHVIANNSVNLYGLRSGTATTSLLTAAFAIVSTTSTGMDVRNNIFANNITGGTTSVANVSAYLPSGGTSAMNLNWNNNSYYFGTDTARQGTGQAGTTAGTNFFTTLGALTAYTSTLSAGGTNDNASLASTGAVPFAANNDLHITNTAPEFNTGVTIASVTNDFDGETRPQGAAYDIGADEVTVAVPGTIQFSSATYSVAEGTPTVTLTVTRTGGSSGAVTANYALAGSGANPATGTASCGTPGEDFVSTGGSVSFANGDAADKTITVPICNDAVYELDQTFSATLSIASGGATLGTPNPATVTITNDDAAPGISIGDVSQAEGNAGTTNFGFGITVTGASEVGSGFLIATADGTANAPSDYTAIITTAVSAPADVNRTSTTYPGLVVSVNGDTMFEANETFFINSSVCTDCTITDNQAVGTIQNDDVQPTVQFSSATYSNSDDIGQNVGKADDFAPQTATITVTRSGATGDAFSVNYATSNGTATGGASCTAGVDYVSSSGTLNFAAGDTSKTFNVTVCTDNLFEGDETVNLTLSSPTAPVILGTPSTAVLTIIDNDAQPSLQFSSATYSVGEGGGTATITVTRTGATGATASVNYGTVGGGTALGGGACGSPVDYVNTSGTLNFAIGDTSKTFSVPICEDAIVEGNETVNLQISSPIGATLGTPNTAVLTIVDNEGDTTPPTVSYTPIPNNSVNPTLPVTATDDVGVTNVTIFYAFNGGGFTPAGCTFASGTPTNGTWNCAIVGQPTPAAVAYYVTATDGTNTTANPAAGATAPNLYTAPNATIPAGTYTNASLSGGTTLAGNVVVNQSLALNGIVNTGANKISLACGVPITGGGEGSYVQGNLERFFCTVSETFTFHVGAPFPLPPVAPEGDQLAPEGILSNYSPVTVTVTGGTPNSSLTVSATDTFLAGSDPSTSASRFWTITENGNLTVNMSFTYRNEDVVGNESNYKVLRRAGGITIQSISSTNNPATNTATITNVSNFSDWGVGNAIPTAANAEISGRVTTASGAGISNASVVISGGNLTAPITVKTGTFGYYNFSGLPVGETYVITVVSKRFVFTNPTRVINLIDSVTDEDFIADSN